MWRSKNPFAQNQSLSESKDVALPHFSQRQAWGSYLANNEASNLWLGQALSAGKLRIFWLATSLLFVILFGRLIYLQLIQGNAYHRLAEGNRLRLDYLPTVRGIIFDRFNTPLVSNVPAFSLYLNPQEVPNEPAKQQEIAQLLGSFPPEADPPLAENQATTTVSQLLDSAAAAPVLIKENLDYQEALSLMIKTKERPGLKVVIDPYRRYLASAAYAHLLGYTGRISDQEKEDYLNKGYQLFERVGRSGLESYYEEILRGQPGFKQMEVDSLGREQKVVAEERTKPGRHLVLAIDNGLQTVITQSLKSRLFRQGAAVVALDPESGKVRALVSWPNFNQNAFSQSLSASDYQKIIGDPLKPLFNRVISGEYPSGSTIKLVVSAAALAEGLVNRFSQVSSVGGVWYDQWFFPDWKAGGHGLTNIIKALAESVNTYFYYLALDDFAGHKGLGLERLLKYFQIFGLGQTLGMDLQGERSGFLPNPKWKEQTKNEVWYPGDTLHLVIGQGDLLVTPLQVAAFTMAVANGGTLFKPELLEEIIDVNTGERQIINPEILKQNLAPRADLKIVAEGMRAAVLWGSARNLAGSPLAIAGKTGTAEVGGQKQPHAWFTSFAPYENPELVLTVLVENGGEGSATAVPIARDVWQWYYDNRYNK